MSIGSELQRYRERSHLTRKRLGVLLGFPALYAEQIIYQWESGRKAFVPLKHFRKLHELIGIPYEKLIP